jgi:hypothetical protein
MRTGNLPRPICSSVLTTRPVGSSIQNKPRESEPAPFVTREAPVLTRGGIRNSSKRTIRTSGPSFLSMPARVKRNRERYCCCRNPIASSGLFAAPIFARLYLELASAIARDRRIGSADGVVSSVMMRLPPSPTGLPSTAVTSRKAYQSGSSG